MVVKHTDDSIVKGEIPDGCCQHNALKDVVDLPLRILNHSFVFNKADDKKILGTGVSIVMENVSELNICEVELEVKFYDIKKNIIDTVKDSICDFRSNTTRSITIKTSNKNGCDINYYEIKILKIDSPPIPDAQGDENIKILKHGFKELVHGHAKGPIIFVDMSIRNISDKTVARAIFDVIFYDLKGNVIDTVRHREYDLKPQTSRKVIVMSEEAEYTSVKSYGIKLLKSYTADFERVQLRKHRVKTVETGKEFQGIVKNISDSSADIAVVVSLTDYKDEKIGSKIVLLNDIAPGSIKDFRLVFNLPEGQEVKSHVINIAEIYSGNGG